MVLGLAFLIGYGFAVQTMQAKIVAGPPWMAWVCPAGPLLLLGILSFAGGIRLVRTFHRPLIVAEDRSLSYGSRRLVAGGDAIAVYVERHTECVSAESGPDYEVFTGYVYVATTSGAFVELPTLYFSNLNGWELAEALGAAIASALGVPLVFEAPPSAHSTPARRVRGVRRLFGSFALVIGVAHWIAGFGLSVAGIAAQFDPAIRMPHDSILPWIGLLFAISGATACYLGCRWFGGTRRSFLRFMVSLALVEILVLLAVRFLA